MIVPQRNRLLVKENLVCGEYFRYFKVWGNSSRTECYLIVLVPHTTLKSTRAFSWTLSVAQGFKGSGSLFPNVKAVELFYLHSYSLSAWWLLDLHHYGLQTPEELVSVISCFHCWIIQSCCLPVSVSVTENSTRAEWLKTQWGEIFLMPQNSRIPVCLFFVKYDK